MNRRLDLLWCDVHNQFWGAWNLYRSYRTKGLPSPYGRVASLRLTWACRGYWD